MVEAMIAAEHGFSNPAQHKLDAQAFLASEGAFEAPEVPQSFASRRENIAQYVLIWFSYKFWSMQQF